MYFTVLMNDQRSTMDKFLHRSMYACVRLLKWQNVRKISVKYGRQWLNEEREIAKKKTQKEEKRQKIRKNNSKQILICTADSLAELYLNEGFCGRLRTSQKEAKKKRRNGQKNRTKMVKKNERKC